LLDLSPKGTLDHSGQLFRCAGDGFVQGRRMMRDSDWLTPFKTGFHHATHGVMADFLVAVHVAQVDLHSGDVIAESAQSAFHYATDVSSQRLVTFDVVTGVYSNLHGFLLF
jgi:hypothetical protein